MSVISKHPQGTLLGLRFGCGGFVWPDGRAQPTLATPEELAMLDLSGLASHNSGVQPCSSAIVINFGNSGKITLKQLQTGLEAAGWLLGLFSVKTVEVRDPLCPHHGRALAIKLIEDAGTLPAVKATLTQYIERAETVLKEEGSN